MNFTSAASEIQVNKWNLFPNSTTEKLIIRLLHEHVWEGGVARARHDIIDVWNASILTDVNYVSDVALKRNATNYWLIIIKMNCRENHFHLYTLFFISTTSISTASLKLARKLSTKQAPASASWRLSNAIFQTSRKFISPLRVLKRDEKLFIFIRLLVSQSKFTFEPNLMWEYAL